MSNIPGNIEEKPAATWSELRDLIESREDHPVRSDRLSLSASLHHRDTLDVFELFLCKEHITLLDAIDKATIERFKMWRLSRFRRANSIGATILGHDLTKLRRVFQFAIENGLVHRNPVSPLKRFTQTKGADPFTADELDRMEAEARRGHSGSSQSNSDWLLFLLARWTGLRRADLVALRWEDVLFDKAEIVPIISKNRTRLRLPIGKELLAALETEFRKRNPQPSEPVLLNPNTSKPFTSRALWEFFVRLGRRAGVEHAHPYRFRVTFAVDMLLRCKNVFYVSQLLGRYKGVTLLISNKDKS